MRIGAITTSKALPTGYLNSLMNKEVNQGYLTERGATKRPLPPAPPQLDLGAID